MIALNEPAPMFAAAGRANPAYKVHTAGGRFVLFAFLPDDPARRDGMLAEIARRRARFDEQTLMLFAITRDPATFARGVDVIGIRWLHDADGAIGRGYGVFEAGDPGRWVLLDPTLRILAIADGAAQDPGLLARLDALPAPGDHAGAPLLAPVLVVPRIFEPELCRELIAFYEAQGGRASGVMNEVDGRTVPVLGDFKRRSDAAIGDPDLRGRLRSRIERRLLPEIAKAFQYRATRIERYMVACYDAAEGGWFNAHRDNTTAGTAHRHFACSINLNAEDFDGGDLRFPEFGPRTYRPPTGGGVVFSCSLLHQATPVTRGRRYVFLPFLFDEAGEAVRQANLHKLGPAPAPAEAAAAD